MIIKNIRIYKEDRQFHKGEIAISSGVFTERLEEGGEEILDGEGCYAIPGLIDIHLHGCMGYDFCDGTCEAIRKIAEYEAEVGVTAIAPATMTLPAEELEQILSTAAAYKKTQQDVREADLVGINMEGPFISRAKKGAQDETHILPCSIELGKRFVKASAGLVKYMGIAPEESEDAAAFIREMKKDVTVALAHTNADYQKAMEAMEAGASHAVHLYNAMPPYTHREPGVIGAVSDTPDAYAELICDGVHVHGAAVRATFKMLGAERIILISDSMRATGMGDGTYTLGGLEVEVKGNQARLAADQALAGSVTNLMGCMRNAVQNMGIPLEEAVGCVTCNPAKSLGIYENYGSISPGKKGNVVLLDEGLQVRAVIKDGVIRVNRLTGAGTEEDPGKRGRSV